MLKIRLMRIGAKKKPFYRVVICHERSKRTGGYVELVGTYNPLTEPKDIKLKQDRIDYWIKQGAQPSDGYLRIIGKAPQRPPRKPKKEKKEAAPAPAAPTPETETAITEEAAKSSEPEASSEVESASETETTADSNSQQTSSEPQEQSQEPENTEASDASTADKQPETESEEKA